jgi:hypothetical protein
VQAGWSGPQILRATAGQGAAAPSLDFRAEGEQCPGCGGGLQVHKSKRRTVVTLDHGPLLVREIRKHCSDRNCPEVASTELTQLVKSGQKYGYDLVVHVGLCRYLAGLQREEIRQRLRDEHGIELSAGSISALCDRFLAYLEALHVARAPQLREALEGGYPLHLDATCDRGKGWLFVCIDGWHNWVLSSARVPSENGASLAPVVEKTVQLFGRPIATVRDMGEGCAGAVEALRKAGVPDLVCHYHFLAAVGKCLFKNRYDRLRDILQKTRCRPEMYVLLRDLRKYSTTDKAQGHYGEGTVRDALKALVLWVIEGDGHSDAPFPFSLPHFEFARRCLQAKSKAEPWVCRPRSEPERRALAYLEQLAGQLESAPKFAATVAELGSRWTAFCELRDVLRLCNAELPRGDVRTVQQNLPALELLRLRQIKEAVDEYTLDLERRCAKQKRQNQATSAPGIILDYLRHYGPCLFGHPAKLDENGHVAAVVERTNNVAEHFFGRHKQQLRRRVGRGQLGRDLEKQPAQVALVSNLRDPEYVRRLAGSLDQLPAAFAALDQKRSVVLPALIRDHRDSQLHRVLRDLLEPPAAPPSASVEGKPKLHPPCAEQVTASAQSLQDLSSEQIQASTTALVAQRSEPPIPSRDTRLPPLGSVLERWFAGRAYRVEVAENGFQWRNKPYPTLTEIACAISGKGHGGFEFFGLTIPWEQRAPQIRGRRMNRSTMIDLPAVPTEF